MSTDILDREIGIAFDRGFYDVKEVKELMDIIDAGSISPELADELVARIVHRVYLDGSIVGDYLLDFRNIVSPPVKEEVNDSESVDGEVSEEAG